MPIHNITPDQLAHHIYIQELREKNIRIQLQELVKEKEKAQGELLRVQTWLQSLRMMQSMIEEFQADQEEPK